MADVPAQVVAERAVTIGKEFTVTVAVFDAPEAQPTKLPDTVYVVVIVGVTTIEAEFEPVFQVNVFTPLAVRVAVDPTQIVDELTTIEGALPTVIEAVVVLEQPTTEVPITV